MHSPWKILEKWRNRARAASWGRKPLPADGQAASTSKARGQAAEDAALDYLQRQGLELVARNYRTQGRGGGEIDLVMQERDGTLVFVEVRQRLHHDFGGAAASIGAAKQRRIVLAARHYLSGLASLPACRFDAVLLGDEGLQWVRAAFDAGEGGGG